MVAEAVTGTYVHDLRRQALIEPTTPGSSPNTSSWSPGAARSARAEFRYQHRIYDGRDVDNDPITSDKASRASGSCRRHSGTRASRTRR